MTYGPVLLIMTAITGDDGESPAHAPKESAAHGLEGGAGEMASGSGPQQPRRQERRRISALRERRRACQRMPNRVVPRSSRFVPVTGTGRFSCRAASHQREARKGQGIKSLAGSRGGAPWQGLGQPPQRPPSRSAKKARIAAEPKATIAIPGRPHQGAANPDRAFVWPGFDEETE